MARMNRTGATRAMLLVTAAAVAGWCGCEGPTTLPAPGAAPMSPAITAAPDAAAPLTEAEAQAEVMRRWNLVAGGGGAFDFHWIAFDQFPHPTYKGGSAEAYQAFAAVLIAFFQGDDNFDFLQRNNLFTLHLRYIFPSGQSGLDTNLRQLVMDFASDRYSFAQLSGDMRATLQSISDRIELATAR